MDSNGKKNIVLCGFMGCGKSTVGMQLAQQLDFEYIDTDDYIAKKACMSVEDIFLNHGEQYFRKLEREAAEELAEREGLVISTGGGMFTREDNADLFKVNGTIIYINTPFTLCFSRIDGSDRPLVKANNRDELSVLYRERRTTYRGICDIELDGMTGSGKVIDTITQRLGL